MRTSARRATLAAVALAAGLAASAPVAHAQERDETDELRTIGLTTSSPQRLVSFDTDDADDLDDLGTVAGLTGGDARLVGIDFRVQDGKLYGVGDKGGLYTLDTRSARAASVGRLTVALNGRAFGVDFNPAANALRIVSDTGQNLRQPFATTPLAATVTDTPLTTPATPPATGTVAVTGVSGAAYTNNDLDASTATTLFDINTNADNVAIQSPANAGTVVATGALGVDAGPGAGFDTYSSLRRGKTVDNDAFATLSVGGRYQLFAIDLLTGAATPLDRFPANRQVGDIAFPLGQD